MKSSGVSKRAIVAGVIGLYILIGVLHCLFVPAIISPPGMQGKVNADMAAALRWNIILYGCVFWLLSCIISLVCALAFRRGGGRLPDFLDAVRVPFIVLDANGRYTLLNREAEQTLGLSRQSDLGREAAPELRQAMTGSTHPDPEADPNPGSIVKRGDAWYHVMDHALSGKDGSQEHIVMLRNVTGRTRLKQALVELNGTVRTLAENTENISDTSRSVSQGASRQASSLSAISASLDEFSKRIQGNTESAEKGTKLAAQAREAAERSGKEISNALTAMTDVQEAGVRIARIVKLIDDIAFQTNLLALNAAVEAARAGRQGKGFAVVADEVRNLAGRSAKAAKDTASMVEDVTERIGNASVFITKLEEMLGNIVHDAIRMADSSASATATSAEQASAILQVNHEISQMNSITQSTQSAAQNSAAAVEQLTDQVAALKLRLDEMNKEFTRRPEKPGRNRAKFAGIALPDGRRMPAAIDLTGEPPPFDDKTFTGFVPQKLGGGGSFGLPNEVNMDAFEEPFKRMAARSGKETQAAPGKFFDPLNGEAPREVRSSEGDRIVKPTQNIKLDDSEFGRY